MKTITKKLAVVNTHTKQILSGLFPALALMIFQPDALASLASVDLGTAGNFAVLAGSGITVAGAANTTTITGDIGTYPTPAVTGLGNVALNGANQTSDAGLMLTAKNDLSTAFTDAAGRAATTSFAPAFDLGGLILTSGVYNDSTSFGLTGALTFDAQGNPNSVFIIQAGSTLITASGSSINLINGAQACHIFWVVGSSATLGTDSIFLGDILAYTSITAGTGATVDGRLLAENGAVTLDYNTITKSVCNNSSSAVPEPTTIIAGAFLLLPLSLAGLRRWRQLRGTTA